ncbi:MAG: enoyl-CoA hydratase [Omnitrophica WOR_2 bacterium RIFCSPLOWO2_02_FULL_63_16]|nr:MAG: enoyl-CoA hydratase [Omnitrophica WOR_2 bacterium GWA2_63_20]OGX17416.1 MAG: enoyl-CoA hydratase [Omnitrophica WOR_2 bacterium GWF2_63_9]OGX35258.1 MAG: enoyl-CoA hydratase [Omnitrophica WOR_2 bacterium RIFCSPHIGHO2_02_FULL_63_39]OGX45101.1 MAG: enoyl-CoA hydratase [Omnitrophica WOR_2 bacterium RIFCSPLOWO2_02_FULL_63_16]OGX48986.1 MAG: enoyl-CoA hydratase [Omnitrophica WOR_2 bacterium RIFCSPLOWO2_12_FULL_63_16]
MQYLKVTAEEGVAVVTIDRPPVNALNRQVMAELDQALEAVKTDAAVKVVILTGGGSFAFVAGADVKEIASLSSGREAAEVAARGQAVMTKIQRLGKPVIAAINGVCLGGGNELAMACHLRLTGDRVRFGQPEINLGIIPGFGGTQRLPRLIGTIKALELILTGDLITAQEAHRLGLVNQVVPQDQVMKAAKDLARKIASKGQVAVQAALRVTEQGLGQPLEAGLAAEAEAFGRVAETQDAKEGVSAFLEKRQPKFQDR